MGKKINFHKKKSGLHKNEILFWFWQAKPDLFSAKLCQIPIFCIVENGNAFRLLFLRVLVF